MYHEPFGSIPAASHSDSSFVCVPDSSARDANGASAFEMRVNASAAELDALDPGRIVCRPDHDEVVVHHGLAADAVTAVHVLLLRLGRVHEQDIGVALLAELERLARADRDRLHRASGLVLEARAPARRAGPSPACSSWWRESSAPCRFPRPTVPSRRRRSAATASAATSARSAAAARVTPRPSPRRSSRGRSPASPRAEPAALDSASVASNGSAAALAAGSSASSNGSLITGTQSSPADSATARTARPASAAPVATAAATARWDSAGSPSSGCGSHAAASISRSSRSRDPVPGGRHAIRRP